MKKFLLYLVIAIAVVSLGLTIYYFSTDNEAIYIKNSSFITINVGDTISTDDDNNELLDFKNRSEYTTLSYSATNVEVQEETGGNAEVLTYHENDHYFVANVGGKSRITVTTNNRNYSRFIIDVLVCDGSEEYPYIVKNEAQLRDDPDARFNESGSNYDYNLKLGDDIELTEDWTPIPSYGKVFDGNHFVISNMHITNPTTRAGFISILERTGVVKNLILENVNIECGVDYVGAIAGESHGVIQTSEVTGSVKNTFTQSGTAYVGGIAGQISSDSSFKTKIDRCGFEGELTTTGSNQVLGGIAGSNQDGIISESYSRSVVNNNNCNFGGIVGLNQTNGVYTADIYDSYFYLTEKGSATTTSKMKGIVYSNTDPSNKNSVAGNYYGGAITSSEVTLAPNGQNFTAITNGYLTSVLNGEGNQFEKESSFVTVKYTNGDPNRLWNFETVWSFTNTTHYPVLNIYSSIGSSYLIDVSNITTSNHITTAQQLYDVLNSNTTDTYQIVNDISLDPNDEYGFVWGDSSTNHAIPYQFQGTIINGTIYDSTIGKNRPCEITDITFKSETANKNVGLVQTLSAKAKIVGLVIRHVTFDAGATAKYVGVVAGASLGAHIYGVEVSDVTVNLSGVGFGTICGYAGNYEGQGIENVKVNGVNATSAYYIYAGGIVGVNLGTIATDNDNNNNYNTVTAVSFVANNVGGAVGANGGKIYNTNAASVRFEVDATASSAQTVYSGTYHVFVGGIAGSNEVTMSSGKYKGSISRVYANLICKAHTGANYDLYIGGVTGYNTSYVLRAYVKRLDVEVNGTQRAIVGGLVGYNMGKISNSIVDKESKVIAPMVASISATENYILKTDNCSVVGGLVGYDAPTSSSTYSIYQCACLANKIQGFYAGGISAISFGKVEYCYCGDSLTNNGGVTVSGHMIGGISAVIAGGFVKNCYSFCALNAGSYNGASYKDITSVLNLEVRSMGGISVFVFNTSTQVIGCYAVVSFAGNGVSYGSCADGYNGGRVTNCVYATSGSISTALGTQISKANLQGADGYKAFKKAIGDTSVWEFDAYPDVANEYPTLVGLNDRLPSDALPTA